MKRSRPLLRPWDGEHIRVGLTFDRRMSKFHNGKIDGGTWRVRSIKIQEIAVPICVGDEAGRKIMFMDVARMLRVGDLCNPRKLAIDYFDFKRNGHAVTQASVDVALGAMQQEERV